MCAISQLTKKYVYLLKREKQTNKQTKETIYKIRTFFASGYMYLSGYTKPYHHCLKQNFSFLAVIYYSLL